MLTLLLIEPLKAASSSRVIAVASNAHMFADALGFDQMKFDQFNKESYGYGWGQYGRSKLYNILFARELGKRLTGTGVTTYSLHPGAIPTELQQNMSPWPVLQPVVSFGFKYLVWPITKDIRHGSQTTICAAVDPALAKESGKYYA